LFPKSEYLYLHISGPAKQADFPGKKQKRASRLTKTRIGLTQKGTYPMLNRLNYRGVAASLCLSVAMLGLAFPASAAAADDNAKEQERVTESGNVMKDLANSSNGIPTGLLNKAECVIILPSVKKAAFIVGASYGRGVMTCRTGQNFDGPWSAPTMMQSSGGSFGLQAGGQATDFVVLVMNDKGARALMKGKLKLGADASIAAGPVGREAEAATNASMSAEMLSYSRAQGVFAGVSLAGSTLGPDGDANKNLYGKKLSAQQIIEGQAGIPASADELLAVLQEKSPKNLSAGK
jgi:lipid-binding SYLF domain-containing protein